ncbi:ABC transporter ATP-binding protein [Schnuerera sp.]|uniref:ABC transporter ATP-binding protein n=1 Tax=Schnuerera sp. TaxID=2794844 RepID=UPI002C98DE0B|nr:ABC transporter ATP-binding protein [Schnuerera sp.]HSH35539.1 ABC transporter ATP-binding protein [Schnuerera sp.]
MSKTMIKVKNLRKVYENLVVANDGISIDIKQGDIFGLLGPNGAGKTTFIRQISGLLKPTEGEIYFDGDKDIIKNPEVVTEYISYYGQRLLILDSHRTWEVVYYTGIFRGLSKEESLRQTELLIDIFNLTESRNKLMSKLSGGQKKLVGIMSSLIALRPILILDEPTNDLDPENRKKVWDILNYANEKFNTTIILVTHNVLEADQIVNKVAIIDEGKIIGMGSPAELKSKLGDQVRLEIYLKEQYNSYNFNFSEIGGIVESYEIKPGVWRFLTKKGLVHHIFTHVVSKISLDQIEDFRIITCTLEDVYLALGGVKDGIK